MFLAGAWRGEEDGIGDLATLVCTKLSIYTNRV